MANWELRWNFNRGAYNPGDSGWVSFWLKNTGDTHLYVSELWLQYEFQGEEGYQLKSSKQIPSKSDQYLSSIRFEIPREMTGIARYRVGYHLWGHEPSLDTWRDLGLMWSELKYYIYVKPTPIYRAFVARGRLPEDRLVGDEIVEMIQNWGFETYTVGINTPAEPEEKWPEIARGLIVTSDCLIAIATPRHLDALRSLWITLEASQGETGIAFGREKPILVIKDRRVTLGGLLGELNRFSTTFDPFDMEKLKQELGRIMPSFRESIVTKRRQDFLKTLVAVGVPLLIGGAVGRLLGSR